MLKRHLCLLMILIAMVNSTFGQNRVKRIFQDNKYDNRTNVIKEQGENDYNILDEKFGDAKVGEVIRIDIEKPKAQRPPRPVRVKTQKKVIKPIVVKEKKEVFQVKGKVEKPKVVKPQVKKIVHNSANASEYSRYKTYQASLPKVKLWKKKRRKKKANKNCYHF